MSDTNSYKMEHITSDLHCVTTKQTEKRKSLKIWVIEFAQPSKSNPFKPSDLVKIYDTLKRCTNNILDNNIKSLTLPPIGKGSEKNFFQTTTPDVIVEMIGWLYFLCENPRNDFSNFKSLDVVNIVSFKPETATHIIIEFNRLIPFNVSDICTSVNDMLPIINDNINSHVLQHQNTFIIIRHCLETINSTLLHYQEIDINVLILCVAANARIIAENVVDILYQKIFQEHSGNNKTFFNTLQLLRSGAINNSQYENFGTVRLIGNKVVHASIINATLVDITAIVHALHEIIKLLQKKKFQNQ